MEFALTLPFACLFRNENPPQPSFSASFRTISKRAGTVTLQPLSSWSNETFASNLCGSISASPTATILSISPLTAMPLTTRFLLPDCFYIVASQFSVVSMNRVILVGLDTLSPAIAGLTLISSTILAQSSGGGTSPALLDLSALSSTYPQLASLTITSCGLQGTLPDVWPAKILSGQLANNALTGSISDNFLSGFAQSTSAVSAFIQLPQNAISGTLPSGLFHKPSTSTTSSSLQGLSLGLGGNRISGPIPEDWLANSTFAFPSLKTLNILLDSNHLTSVVYPGALTRALPNSMLSSLPTALISLALSLTSNLLSGTVPADIYINAGDYPAALQTLTIDLSSNQLFGTVPSTLIQPASTATSRLSQLTLSLRNNSLSGLIPNTLLSFTASVQPFGIALDLSSNSLTGTLPTGMYGLANGFGSFVMSVSSNSLTGIIPNSWAPFSTYSTMTSFAFYADRNSLSGTLPTNLFVFSDYSTTRSFIFQFSGNSLSGTIPATLFSSVGEQTLTGAFATLSVNFSRNSFTGSLSDTLFSNVPSPSKYVSLSLDLSYNQLSGAIPTSLLANGPTATGLYLYLSSNQFSGSLPSKILQTAESGSTNPSVTIDLSNNKMDGTIPSDLLTSSVSTVGATFTLLLSSNRLSGSLPLALLTQSSTAGSSALILDLSNNTMTGEIDSNFFASSSSLPNLLSLSLASNPLSGSLPSSINSLSSANSNMTTLTLDMSNTMLSGSIPSDWFTTANLRPLTSLKISARNARLSGSVRDSIFQLPVGSVMSLLSLDFSSNPLLTGSFPLLSNLNPTWLTYLNLSGTNLDFCSNRPEWSPSGASLVCSLDRSPAVLCTSLYPSYCFSLRTCETPKPDASFTCIDGVWTHVGSFENPTLVLPPSGSSVILGNLTSSEIIFGFNASLIIQGCANNLSSITIELTIEQIEEIIDSKSSTPLITYESTNPACSGLGNTPINLKTQGSSCKKAKARTVESNGVISSLFTIDSSGCNRWWIILVSVICGLILILIIVLVLLAIFVPSVRVFFRPFSNRNKNPEGAI